MSISGPGDRPEDKCQGLEAGGDPSPGPTEQWDRALTKGNATRLRIAEIRRKLEEGSIRAHCVIRDPALANKYVREVLLWQKRWGPRMVGACISAMHAYNPKCSELTERQVAIMSYCCTEWKIGPGSKLVLPDNQFGVHQGGPPAVND